MTVTPCPHCQEELEYEFQALASSGDLSDGEQECPYCGKLIDVEKQYSVDFRVTKAKEVQP
jgi:sarcosine oxidase delta subunit